MRGSGVPVSSVFRVHVIGLEAEVEIVRIDLRCCVLARDDILIDLGSFTVYRELGNGEWQEMEIDLRFPPKNWAFLGV